MRILLVCMLLVCMLCLSGCLSAPKLTAGRAARCVQMTFAYQNLVRGVAGPITIEVDEADPDLIELHVLAAAGRMGRFRIWRGDRRIELWDARQAGWQAVGVCD